MIKLGLVGKNISHSQSPKIYRELLGEVEYFLFDYQNTDDIPCLDELFSKCQGISITSPYKRHFLNQVIISPEIRPLNAINCIYKKEGELHGTNTDYLACKQILGEILDQNLITQIAIMGNGPMAHLLLYILNGTSVPVTHLTRENYGDLVKYDFTKDFPDSTLVINCCSRSFNFQGTLSKLMFFWDMNYQMKHNRFISSQAHYEDGENLLKLQAKYALPFWNLLPIEKI